MKRNLWESCKKAVLLGGLGFLLVGCQADDLTKDTNITAPQKMDAESPKDVEALEEEVFPHTFPLTGVGTKAPPNNAALAVTINNHPSARPQSGLQAADIVYEVLAEGAITRFLAIYHSQYPDTIGPVRSAREYYIELSQGYESLYVSYGHSPGALSLLASGTIPHVNGMGYAYSHGYDGQLFWRESSQRAPHNVYTSSDELIQGVNHYDYILSEPAPLLFTKTHSSAGEEVQAVEINYSTRYNNKVIYTFDQETNKYKRVVNGEEQVDRLTKQPLAIKNVFIVEMTHGFLDDQGRRKIELSDGGKAWLLTEGRMQEVTWENINGRILPMSNGQLVPFTAGNTWINIIPKRAIEEQRISFQ
ncbi:DUF3048 domain-containing protein [Bacillaceae bacterium SIJ1]|uniref:DUF3048 domain-containing protein n=1 Tax=Litoribacterium kuwaitense TaxID=1398745 RepID=UPI0013EB2C3E|nr:DUF3048 domain-containing protein [Litoribacterium kuwaitense]NGP46078.1 DUF3048 domain-containing protein [Litoribacterium kuwaitense]